VLDARVTASFAVGHSAFTGSMDLDHSSHFHLSQFQHRISFYSKDQQKIQQTLFWQRETDMGNDMGVVGPLFLARPADKKRGLGQ